MLGSELAWVHRKFAISYVMMIYMLQGPQAHKVWGALSDSHTTRKSAYIIIMELEQGP